LGRGGGGQLEVIAAILQRPVIEEIFRNVGFDRQPQRQRQPMAGRANQGARLSD
jgi:hypothetical protein